MQSLNLLWHIKWIREVNIKDLQALTLVGTDRENLVLDPLALAVQHLNNQFYKTQKYQQITCHHSQVWPTGPHIVYLWLKNEAHKIKKI